MFNKHVYLFGFHLLNSFYEMIEEVKPVESKCSVSKRKDLDVTLPENLVWPKHFGLYLAAVGGISVSCIPFFKVQNLYLEIQNYGKLSTVN